jgi:hypothetical protein
MHTQLEYIVWHLTPSGWVRGTHRFRTGDKKILPSPPDTLLTCTYFSEIGSVLKINAYTTKDWQIDDMLLVEKMLERFGTCPKNSSS